MAVIFTVEHFSITIGSSVTSVTGTDIVGDATKATVISTHIRYTSASANDNRQFRVRAVINTAGGGVLDLFRGVSGTEIIVEVDVAIWDTSLVDIQGATYTRDNTETANFSLTGATLTASFLVVSEDHSADSARGSISFRVLETFLSSATQGDVHGDNGPDVNGQAYVVTALSAEFVVQNFSGSFSSTNTASETLSPSVDTGRSHLNCSYRTLDTTNDLKDTACTAFLASASTVTIERSASVADTVTYRFAVVEWADGQANVHRGTDTSTSASIAISFTAVVVANSFAHIPSGFDRINTSNDRIGSSDVDAGYITVEIDSTTAGTLKRGDVATSATVRQDWEVVEALDAGAAAAGDIAPILARQRKQLMDQVVRM